MARTPIHAGEILKEDFMEPFGLSSHQLATALHVSPNRVSEIVAGRRAVSAETAMRLARYFGTSAEFWLNLQMLYELDSVTVTMGAEIDRTVHPRAA